MSRMLFQSHNSFRNSRVNRVSTAILSVITIVGVHVDICEKKVTA